MKAKGDYAQLWPRRESQFILIGAVTVIVSLTPAGARVAPIQAPVFPDLIQLPADFGPEGIAVDNGHTFYVGSLAPATLGKILVGDLRTGGFSELVPPTGRIAAGMKLDSRSNYLYAAGGTSGRATIYDADTGDEITFYQFMHRREWSQRCRRHSRAAYFTDPRAPTRARGDRCGRATGRCNDHPGRPTSAFVATAPSGFPREPTGLLRRRTENISSSFT